jgi:hypothetical protein
VLSLKEIISKDYALSFLKNKNRLSDELNGRLFLRKFPPTVPICSMEMPLYSRDLKQVCSQGTTASLKAAIVR